MYYKKGAVIFLAGSGKRFNSGNRIKTNKALISIKNKTVIENILDNLYASKDLKVVYLVLGYQQERFLFLKAKYPSLHFLYNDCYKTHKSACSLGLLKNILLNTKQLFLISGDMILYHNYFLTSFSHNVMTAFCRKKPSKRSEIAYVLNLKRNIIGTERMNAYSKLSFYQLGEFSVLNADFLQALIGQINDLILKSSLDNKDIYEVLIKTSLESKIPLKMHLLKIPGPLDIDYPEDLINIKNIL